MRISDCLNSNNLGASGIRLHAAAANGFTLFETLVVLLIITVLAGLTVARLPVFAQNADFDLESRRLELLLNMARNEAVLDSMEFGFRTTAEGYEFLIYDDATQDWREVEPPFHARHLPEELNLTLRADNTEFKLLGEDLPPVLILSSGETTPVKLILTSRVDKQEKTLTTDGYSAFSWDEDE